MNAINGKNINNSNLNVVYNKIVINSNEVNENDIFIALKGEKYDGHDYIYDVLEKKPAAIIIDGNININTDIPIIYTSNNYDTLLEIAKLYREKFNGIVIAITGSVGKTMTKELISMFLSTKYKVLKSEGNKNNHIGMPLTLMNLNNDYDVVVLELGMNHKGEISKLSKICKPNIAVITNIGTAHIGNLGSQKNIFKAKMEIIDGMKTKVLVVNKYDKYLKRTKAIKCEVNNVVSHLAKTIFEVEKYKYILNLPGSYLVNNCALAIKVGKILGIENKIMKKKLLEYKPLENRLNIIKINNITLINDYYNSNYESTQGLVKMLDQIDNDKIIILGDILELGKYSKKIHQKIGKLLNHKNFYKIIFIGNEMYNAYKKCRNSIYFSHIDELYNYLDEIDLDNKIIALKASHNMHFELISEYITKKSV